MQPAIKGKGGRGRLIAANRINRSKTDGAAKQSAFPIMVLDY